MIHMLSKILIALISGIKNLNFNDKPVSASGETGEKKNTDFGDCIIFLSCNFALAFVVCILMGQVDPLSYTQFHTFTKVLFIVSLPAIIVYVLLTRLLNNNGTRKMAYLVLLVMLVNVSAFFTGRFIYDHSVKNMLSAIEKNYSPQIQAREKEITDRIDVLSRTLQNEPENRMQAYESISIINELLDLHKEAHAINSNFQESIFFAVKREPVLKPAELKILLKEHMNIDVDAFSDFQGKYQSWYNTTTKCLSARKESYQSYISDENDGMQMFKMRKADDACSQSSEKLTSMTKAQSKFMGANL